jgi:hypothetical protein
VQLRAKLVEFWTDSRAPAHAFGMRRLSRQARRLRASACGLALVLVACDGAPEARWLELERVTPALLESAGTLRIEGSGFAAGQPCEVQLDGRSHRPGSPPVAVHARLAARAVSESEVAVPLDAQALLQLGGHGSFEGRLQLRLPVRGGEGYLAGELPVRLDVSLPLARGVGHEQRLRERARALLDFAGIVPAEEASLLAGLVVKYARPGGPGAALGLRQGDVIARAGGVSVHALADLAPPRGARSLELLVQRPGARAELRVQLPLHGLHAPDLSAELARLSALLGWVVCCALLLWPGPSPVGWLATAFARVRSAPPSAIGPWGGELRAAPHGTWRTRAAQSMSAAAWPASSSAAGVLLVWLEPAGFLAVRSLSIYLGLCAVSVTLTLMSEAGSRRERLRAAAGVAGRMLVMGVLIACACALSGTRAFDGMVVGQGAWPVRWAMFQKPALLVAFPLYVLFASRLGAATLALPPHGHAGSLLIAERVLTNVVLCALGVAIFAGGWQAPEQVDPDDLDPRLVGALLYVLKAWGFAYLLAITRRAALGSSLGLRAIAALCAATVALTALWLWLAPSAAFELALGRALFASAALWALASWWRQRTTSVTLAGALARPPSSMTHRL